MIEEFTVYVRTTYTLCGGIYIQYRHMCPCFELMGPRYVRDICPLLAVLGTSTYRSEEKYHWLSSPQRNAVITQQGLKQQPGHSPLLSLKKGGVLPRETHTSQHPLTSIAASTNLWTLVGSDSMVTRPRKVHINRC